MRVGFGAVLALMLWMVASVFGPAVAQDLSALARLDPAGSEIADTEAGVDVTLQLSQPVPWRLHLMDNPPRLVMDAREVDWTGIDKVENGSKKITALRAGLLHPGWSRLVLEMNGPFVIDRSEMATDEGVVVRVQLVPATAAAFAAAVGQAEPEDWALPKPADLPPPVVRGEGPVVVMLDPGHGGIDPGAERDGQSEAKLVLGFARELKEALVRDGGFKVSMTRDDDVFVPLETRLTMARAAHADVFISIHADAIPEGEATGVTIYTLADEATDEASEALAERHDRDDLLAGVDLAQQDDVVAKVLMDMARRETQPRTERLAVALEAAINAAGLKMHRHPHQYAGFSVLKSPDTPSTLIELGFLSSGADLARMMDPEWRAKMTEAIKSGLKVWAKNDAALSQVKAQ